MPAGLSGDLVQPEVVGIIVFLLPHNLFISSQHNNSFSTISKNDTKFVIQIQFFSIISRDPSPITIVYWSTLKTSTLHAALTRFTSSLVVDCRPAFAICQSQSLFPKPTMSSLASNNTHAGPKGAMTCTTLFQSI